MIKLTVPINDGETLQAQWDYNELPGLGCHVGALTNFSLRIPSNATNNALLKQGPLQNPTTVAWALYRKEILQTLCQYLERTVVTTLVLLSDRINRNSFGGEYCMTNFLTSEIAATLIELKIGVVTTSHIIKNRTYPWEDLHLNRVWLWTPPSYVDHVIPGTVEVFNEELIGDGFFGKVPVWAKTPEVLLNSRVWEFYPHYQKIKDIAGKFAAKLPKIAKPKANKKAV